MNANSFFSILFNLFLLLLPIGGGSWAAAPINRPTPPPTQREDLTAVLRQLKTAIADLKYELANYNAELKMLDERIKTQELNIEELRDQIEKKSEAERESFYGKQVDIESRLSSFDAVVKNLMVDTRQMRNQANESTAVLLQYKQKLLELENRNELQQQHIKNLESALKSLMELVQIKEPPSTNRRTGSEYEVLPGDTLEKIARQMGTTVQRLKEYNHLTQDRIRVGQKLKVP